MKILLMEKAVLHNREYETGETANVDNDKGRQLIKNGVAVPIKTKGPASNEAIENYEDLAIKDYEDRGAL